MELKQFPPEIMRALDKLRNYLTNNEGVPARRLAAQIEVLVEMAQMFPVDAAPHVSTTGLPSWLDQLIESEDEE